MIAPRIVADARKASEPLAVSVASRIEASAFSTSSCPSIGSSSSSRFCMPTVSRQPAGSDKWRWCRSMVSFETWYCEGCSVHCPIRKLIKWRLQVVQFGNSESCWLVETLHSTAWTNELQVVLGFIVWLSNYMDTVILIDHNFISVETSRLA